MKQLIWPILAFTLCCTLYGTTVKEILELRSSGFDEKDIIGLVDLDSKFEAKDFIALKKEKFSTEFILGLKKRIESAPKVPTGNVPKELSEKELLEKEISENQTIIAKIEEDLVNFDRAISRMNAKSYSTPGLFGFQGSILKRNGYDESLGAPNRDSNNIRTTLSSSLSFSIKREFIDEFSINDLVDDWIEWKRSQIETTALGQREVLGWGLGRSMHSASVKITSVSRRSYDLEVKKIKDPLKRKISYYKEITASLLIKKKHGPYEEQDGEYKIKGTWKRGLNVGKRTILYKNGQVKTSDNWIEGNKVGLEENWNEDGKLESKVTWQTGFPISFVSFHPNGKERLTFSSDHGQGKGTFTEFKKDGSVQSTTELSVQVVDGDTELDSDSILLEHQIVNNLGVSTARRFVLVLDGLHKKFDGDNRSTYSGSFKQGNRVGLHQWNDFEDNKTFSFLYSSDGEATKDIIVDANASYNLNGIHASVTSGRFSSDWRNLLRFTGKVKYKEPSFSEEFTYFEDSPKGPVKIFDSSGQIVRDFERSSGTDNIRKIYRENGKLYCTLSVSRHRGVLIGPSQIFDENGELLLEANYMENKRDGLTTLYMNGKKMAEANFKQGILEGKVSAWYLDGDKYNPNKGFLAKKVLLYYAPKSLWREGSFSKGYPNDAHREFSANGKLLKEVKYKKDTKHYGILDLHVIDPASTKNIPFEANRYSQPKIDLTFEQLIDEDCGFFPTKSKAEDVLDEIFHSSKLYHPKDDLKSILETILFPQQASLSPQDRQRQILLQRAKALSNGLD